MRLRPASLHVRNPLHLRRVRADARRDLGISSPPCRLSRRSWSASAASRCSRWADYLRLVPRLELAACRAAARPVPPERFYWTLRAQPGCARMLLLERRPLVVVAWAVALEFPADFERHDIRRRRLDGRRGGHRGERAFLGPARSRTCAPRSGSTRWPRGRSGSAAVRSTGFPRTPISSLPANPRPPGEGKIDLLSACRAALKGTARASAWP